MDSLKIVSLVINIVILFVVLLWGYMDYIYL